MLVWACSLDLDSNMERLIIPDCFAPPPLPPLCIYPCLPHFPPSLPHSALTRQDQTRQLVRCGSPWQRAPPSPNSWRHRDSVKSEWETERMKRSFSQLALNFCSQSRSHFFNAQFRHAHIKCGQETAEMLKNCQNVFQGKKSELIEKKYIPDCNIHNINSNHLMFDCRSFKSVISSAFFFCNGLPPTLHQYNGGKQ